jgi:hypothetical protein
VRCPRRLLVIGREVPVGTRVTEADLADYVAALVFTNDVSARDLQLPKTQFYRSKSYPTFTPTGPALVLVDAAGLRRFGDLRIRLRVNGEVRQESRVGLDISYRPAPAPALSALARFQRLDPGDIVLTGTPGGTALTAPARPVALLAGLLPPAARWKLFFRSQQSNPKYLRDVVSALPLSAEQQAEVSRRGGAVVAAGPGGELARWLGRGRARAVVVRPDGTVMRAGRDLEAICRALPALAPPGPRQASHSARIVDDFLASPTPVPGAVRAAGPSASR